MYTAIQSYCENENDHGLFLMDMPTGFGKTYSVLKYIFEASLDEANKEKKYFFITPLKKNLPQKDLQDFFAQAGKLTEFHEKFLFLDSNWESAVTNFTDALHNAIPDDIRKTDEYKAFSQEISFLQKADRDYRSREMAKGIEKNFRERTEPAFRRKLEKLLAHEYSSVRQRITAIKTEKHWQWLGLLYPAVFTRDRQIFFMSMDKFLVRNATIVEPSYMFYNSKLVEKAVIFIDEFDSTKDTMLKNIIQNGLRDKIDFIELFKSIYAAMQTNEFPAALTTPSRQRMESNYRNQSLQSILEDTKQLADEIYQNYSLQFSHRTTAEAEPASKNFLFQDHQFHSILNGSNNYVSTVSDRKNKINAIRFTETKPESDRSNIQVMLGKLRGFMRWFQMTVNILAINYRQCKNERRQEGEDEFSQESAIRTVLSLFHLRQHDADYLTSQIMISTRKSKSDTIAGAEFDRSLYEHGFRYYCFEDDSMHDMQSHIMMYSFQNTPEKFLLRFCERAKVIGISATATVPTVIGNFDLDYLRSKMQSVYYQLPNSDYERLRAEFQEAQTGYQNDIQIHTELLGSRDYSLNTWMQVVSDRDLAEKIYLELERSVLESNQNNYHKERYFRIAMAFKRFLQHDDIQSFLCLLTKHPAKNDRYLDLNLLLDIFEAISWEINPAFNAKQSVVLLKGDDYDAEKNRILERLTFGEKLFVISVYQTLGAGQNLQYPVQENFKHKLIRSNSRHDRDEKDFDAIYLDKPTNLVVNMEKNWQEDAFIKYLFQIEFLQENGEISLTDALKHIRKAFKCYMTANVPTDYAPYPYDTQSVRMFATRTIIQAIGRICRTNLKRKHIYIFADDRIADSMDLSVTDHRILNPEFLALVDAVKEKQTKPPVIASLENKAELISNRVSRNIDQMLRDKWTDDRIQKWQQLRELVLTSPTASAEQAANNFIISNYYIQLPQKSDHLYYSQEEDYHKIKVSFTHTHLTSMEENAANTKLDRFMQFGGLREYFHSQRYATEFTPNDFIMSPALWNNIYKGALGEVVGRYLFETVLHISLEEITNPEHFELFDYQVPGLPVFVDFKNWHESTEMNWNEEVEKIRYKAEQCGCRLAIIANIMTQAHYQMKHFKKGNLEILLIPTLLYDDNDRIFLNREAFDKIWRCINELPN